MPGVISSRRTAWVLALTAGALVWTAGTAYAGKPVPGGHDTTEGGADGKTLLASAGQSRIKVTQVSGPTGGKRGAVSSVDVNWKPPACWYEPVFTPAALKDFSETNGVGDVGIHEYWAGKGLWTDHYRDDKPTTNVFENGASVEGYKDYNLGQDGYFWRSVAPDISDPDSWDCTRIMFWQPAGEIPKIAHAPTPKTLAEYAYNKVEVPDTEIELKPTTKSTVNLPTWVWLDKATFQDVKVRAELPNTGLWAETTARPVALHLDPGTEDAQTYPASGDCEINADGSIGTPYEKGAADRTPPCGIRYLKATDGTPYRLSASVTWQITWQGANGTGGDLPDGTFETTQDMNVQEIQSINR